MDSGTLTPDTSTLVEVASRNLWFTLLRGVPFSLKGPGTRRRPVSRLLSTTTLVPSCEDDGDSAGGEAGPHGPRVLGEVVDGGAGGGGVLGWVVSRQLLRSHHPGAAILGSTDLLLDEDWALGGGLLDSGLLGELVDGLLVVGGALTEPVHSALKRVVTWLPLVLVLSHYFSCRSESSNISL